MAKEIIMNNVREKLSKARETCVGMSEEVYIVTDYMSTVVSNTLSPHGMAMCLVIVNDDVLIGKCGISSSQDKQFSLYLQDQKNLILSQIPYVLQVIDEIAEPEFADEVRVNCKKMLNWDPPKRTK